MSNRKTPNQLSDSEIRDLMNKYGFDKLDSYKDNGVIAGVLWGVLWGVIWGVFLGVIWGVLWGVFLGVLWGVIEITEFHDGGKQ